MVSQFYQTASKCAHFAICLVASYGMVVFSSTQGESQAGRTSPVSVKKETQKKSLNFVTSCLTPKTTPVISVKSSNCNNISEFLALLENLKMSLGVLCGLVPMISSFCLLSRERIGELHLLIGQTFGQPSLSDKKTDQITFGHLSILLQTLSHLLQKLSTGFLHFSKETKEKLSQSMQTVIEMAVALEMSQCSILLSTDSVDTSYKMLALSEVSNDLKTLTAQIHGRFSGSGIALRRSLSSNSDTQPFSKHLATPSGRIRVPSSPLAGAQTADSLQRMHSLSKAIDNFLEASKSLLPVNSAV
ncbi:hypothetical protein Ciccas_001944 [Cichlidogyrus casuarinus]|uniref:Uncharacterized protein n=1 Tax=Cichlidogyrus casuarinus TaxID=1844966 RepID=A0ABD2QIM9_9PLAT